MTVNLGTWELRTSTAKPAAGRAIEYQIVRVPTNPTSREPDIEETVGDFIARHVLEKDSVFFEG